MALPNRRSNRSLKKRCVVRKMIELLKVMARFASSKVSGFNNNILQERHQQNTPIIKETYQQ